MKPIDVTFDSYAECNEDVLKTSCKDVLKTPWRRVEGLLQEVLKISWRRLGRRKIVTLKTSSIRLEDMSWRLLEDMSWRPLKVWWRQTKYLLGISVYSSWDLTNLNVYLTSLYFTNLYLTTLKRIQNALLVWCYEISLIQIRHCRKGETIKTNF